MLGWREHEFDPCEVLLEIHDEWATVDRCYLSESSMKSIYAQRKEITGDDTPQLPAA